MIRAFMNRDLDNVMKLWLETNITAHSFVNQNYWKNNYEIVKQMIPNTSVFVYEEEGDIQGFIGIMDYYIAGIFVDEKSQSKGIGRALLNYIKEYKKELLLQVYKKNDRAVKFYLREGFFISKEQMDENTGETEFVMSWKK